MRPSFIRKLVYWAFVAGAKVLRPYGREKAKVKIAGSPEHPSPVLVILGRDGTIRYISPSIEPLLGYAPSELIGTNAVDLLHPYDIARMARCFGTIAQGANSQLFWIEFRARHRDGSWRCLKAFAAQHLHGLDARAILITELDTRSY